LEIYIKTPEHDRHVHLCEEHNGRHFQQLLYITLFHGLCFLNTVQ